MDNAQSDTSLHPSIMQRRSFLPDPVMGSLVVTSCWLLVAYVQTERPHYLFMASLTGILGFLTKISGIFVGIPMLYAISTVLIHKRMLRSKQFVLICVATVLTLIPVAAYYLWAIHISRTYPPYYIAAGDYWIWKFGLSHFLSQNYFLTKLYLELKWFWTEPVIVLVIIGLFLRPPQFERNPEPGQQLRDRFSQVPWLFHWWMLAFVIYYLIAAQGLVNNPTNLNIANPAACALAANFLIVLASFARRIAGSPASIALIAAVFLTVLGVGHKRLQNFALYPWAEDGYKLGLALRQITQPNDLVVTIAGENSDFANTVAIYYSQRRGWMFPPVSDWSLK